jgi:hypothetical protein
MLGLKSFKEHYKVLNNLYIFPLYHQLSGDQLCRRPDENMNSIAWNLWHVARAEDVGFNRLMVAGIQVMDAENWSERMAVPHRHIGTGMSKAEVDTLNTCINLEALMAYHQAVHYRTLEIMEQIDSAMLAEHLDADRLSVVLQDGQTLHPDGAWVYDIYLNQSKDWLALHLSANHPWYHLGEIMAIRSMLT